MTQDVTILYQGGSGGFALFYYLLLTGKFQCTTEQAWQKINQQFPVALSSRPDLWKTYESWPDNLSLKTQSGQRLFLICNPLWSDHMIELNHMVSDDTYRILLYAPLKLQLRMAWEKRAYWFTNISRLAFDAPDHDRDYIRWIKRSGVEFNGMIVDPCVPKILDEFQPNQILTLQDLLTAPADEEQQKFMRFWIHLQSKKAQNIMRT